MPPLFLTSQHAIIRFCAEECNRQETYPMAVYYMIQAWEHMAKISHRAQGYRIIRRDVLALGAITEPTRNKHGFRQSAVFFRDSNQTALPHTLIPGTLQQLLDAQTDIDPQDFYAEFESIHPFLDGNGRVGTILANYLNGTFQAPVEFHYQPKASNA